MFRRPIFFVAHPGHELRVWGWLDLYKPTVHVLTDGSGRSTHSRIPATDKLLRQIGARPGTIFGDSTDMEFYRAIVEYRPEYFLERLDRLVDCMVTEQADAIIGDAHEGFNPAHDICRALIDAAALMAARKLARSVANYDFAVTEFDSHLAETGADDRLCHTLKDAKLAAKLRSAENYEGLAGEIAQAIATLGTEYFRTEWIRNAGGTRRRDVQQPYYEKVGQERVAAGMYGVRIEYAKHVEPVFRAIQRAAGTA